MEVGIKVVSEDIHKGIVTHTNSCFFTMVAMKEDGTPGKVPTFEPSTREEMKRHTAAMLRKQLRQELETRYEQAMAGL